jgi:hypothetical protein
LLKTDSALWLVIEMQVNKLMPMAQGILMEVLNALLPDISFDLDLNHLIEYAGRQYMARLNVLEQARES